MKPLALAFSLLALTACGGGGVDDGGCLTREEVRQLCLETCADEGIFDPATCQRTVCDDDGIQETVEQFGLCLEE